MQIDIVFYDVTTFHFESQIPDNLRDFGFSKAGKFNEVQKVLGMLIDCEGRPVGYEFYPGNTFDSKILLKILRKLKEQFNLKKVIIIADKVIHSKLNLKHIKDNGFDNIVSAHIKNMKKSVQEEILPEKDYQKIGNSDLYYWQEDFEDDSNNHKSVISGKRGYKSFVIDDRKQIEDESYHLRLDEERILEEL